MTKTPIEGLITILAEIMDSDLAEDPFALIIAAANKLNSDERLEVLAAFEICPIHLTTIDICADDDIPECRSFRD